MSDYEDDLEYEEQDGDTGSCAVCGGDIIYWDSPHGGWWSHVVHPADEHDAVLGGPA